MRMLKLALAITTIVLLLTATASSRRGEATKQSEQPDFSAFPIVDFEAKEPKEPKVKAALHAKGRKYSKKYAGQINEELHQIFTNSDRIRFKERS